MSAAPPAAPRARGRVAWRDVDGILLLDKPLGLSSSEAVQRVRRLYRAAKAGHTGSLDPLASGLLPICLGQATKVSGLLLDANKTYKVRMRLGERMSTGDCEGEVVERLPVGAVSPMSLANAFMGRMGPQQQVPPMYSALKHQGQRLYDLARRGVEVERQPRDIVIYQLALYAIEGVEVEFEVVCSKGTYVRTLVEDLARDLGTCGHVVALRRIGLGPFAATPRTLAELEQLAGGGEAALDGLLLPADAAVPDWPDVRLGVAEVACVLQGQAVFVAGPPGARVRMYGADGAFLGVGQMTPDGRRLAPVRIMLNVANAAVTQSLA